MPDGATSVIGSLLSKLKLPDVYSYVISLSFVVELVQLFFNLHSTKPTEIIRSIFHYFGFHAPSELTLLFTSPNFDVFITILISTLLVILPAIFVDKYQNEESLDGVRTFATMQLVVILGFQIEVTCLLPALVSAQIIVIIVYTALKESSSGSDTDSKILRFLADYLLYSFVQFITFLRPIFWLVK